MLAGAGEDRHQLNFRVRVITLDRPRRLRLVIRGPGDAHDPRGIGGDSISSGSDEHLRTVARIYSDAPSKPTAAVEAAFPFHSRSTVGRWLKDCRERGFLPKTTRGRVAPNINPEKED